QPVRRPLGRARRRGGLLIVAASIPTDSPREKVGDNPLVEGLERLPVAPTTMVIFGASGDLAKRKLLPALYNLAHEGALPERFNLIGAARREQTDDEFRDVARESIQDNSRREPDEQVLDGLFEPVWNRNYIDHVQITAAEDIGIGTRAGYYDASGALRDLVQNHMLQLLTLLCMEPPSSFDADKVRDEKVKVLDAIRPPSPEEVAEMTVRAQYTAGSPGGEEVPGYLDEADVPADSETETYAALRLEVHNWRWEGVPFFLRTGKRLSRKTTEIAVQLKPVPHLAFASDGSVGVQPNLLILAVQPNEGVSLSLGAKIPGSRMRIRPVNMEFLYGSSFMSQSPEAYERLLMDAMRGDATLFTRDDEVEAQWRIIDPILEAWGQLPGPL